MPEPVKTEKKEPEVKIIPSETPQEKEKVTIDAETGKPLETPAPAPASVSPDDFKKALNTFGYELRKQRQEFEQALQRIAPAYRPAPAVEKVEPQPDFDPEMDVVAKTNYQKAIKMMAAKEAETIAEKKIKSFMEARDKEQQVNFQNQQIVNQRERSIAWALERTPSLNDETSDEYKSYRATFDKMLTEDPSLKFNPLAARVVWHEWKTGTVKETPAQNQEAERLKRVVAGAVPQGRQTSGKKTYQLTQDELEFCEINKLSPARYAERKEANFKEGVVAK